MRVKDYPDGTLSDTSRMLFDNEETGTHSVDMATLKQQFGSGGGGSSDFVLPFDLRKFVYRGKAMGSTFTQEQHDAIANGTFDDLYLGDYWENDRGRYYIADFDYHNPVDESASNHSITMFGFYKLTDEEYNVDNKQIWGTIEQESGYYSSSIRTFINSDIKTSVENIFTLNGFYQHLSNGYYSGQTIYRVSDTICYIELPTEYHIFGSLVRGTSYEEIDTNQLLLFRQAYGQFDLPMDIDSTVDPYNYYFLRDISKSTTYVSGIQNGFLTSLPEGGFTRHPSGFREKTRGVDLKTGVILVVFDIV